jgi:hypothetical protein
MSWEPLEERLTPSTLTALGSFDLTKGITRKEL